MSITENTSLHGDMVSMGLGVNSESVFLRRRSILSVWLLQQITGQFVFIFYFFYVFDHSVYTCLTFTNLEQCNASLGKTSYMDNSKKLLEGNQVALVSRACSY